MNRLELLIKKLDLLPHPEGGFYKETYRCKEGISKENLSKEFSGSRSVSTAIYFLLKSDDFSAFHKINQDEIWHFHEGSAIKIHQISPAGEYSFQVVGNAVEKNQSFQHVVPAGYWFAASVEESNSYSLVGCTVAPGFDFDDFVLAKRQNLIELFPEHETIITELTRI
jgi:predicted cupin superfamily sugar epimerase